MENTGQIIRKRRLELGYSQESLAKALGCSQANIAKLEKGSTPDIRIGMLIQRYLGLDVVKLFVDGEESLSEGSATPTKSIDRYIDAVISMMSATDEEGKIRAKLAVSDVLAQYKFNKTRIEATEPNLDEVIQNIQDPDKRAILQAALAAHDAVVQDSMPKAKRKAG